MGPRRLAPVHALVSRVDDGTCDFVTDLWAGFFSLLSEKRHFYGKDLTFPIEATNSDIRHYGLSEELKRPLEALQWSKLHLSSSIISKTRGPWIHC